MFVLCFLTDCWWIQSSKWPAVIWWRRPVLSAMVQLWLQWCDEAVDNHSLVETHIIHHQLASVIGVT